MNRRNLYWSSFAALIVVGALSGCAPESSGANDVADEIGKALDPKTPEYVDKPAADPQRPQ